MDEIVVFFFFYEHDDFFFFSNVGVVFEIADYKFVVDSWLKFFLSKCFIYVFCSKLSFPMRKEPLICDLQLKYPSGI